MSQRFLVTLVTLGLVLAACANGGNGSSAPSSSPVTAASVAPSAAPSTEPTVEAVELTIYAAASLKGALEATKPVYEASHPGVTLTISTDSSSALAIQIEEGAPADVFLSADTKNPTALADKGLTYGAPVEFATNELTVIVPNGNPGGIATPADLAKAGVKVIAAGDEVPITKYATQLVDNLAKEPGYPADFAARYQANIASKEDNVKAVVAKLELGEGDAAIVYVTDAEASTVVATIDVPESANVVATYAGVVTKASTQPEAAHEFLAWFAGADGQAILSGFGFVPPTK